MKFVKYDIDNIGLPLWYKYDQNTSLSSARLYNNSQSFYNINITKCEIVDADDWADLNYKDTKIYSSRYKTGWLSHEGEFFGCDARGHAVQAKYVHKMQEYEMEEQGFIKITYENTFIDNKLMVLVQTKPSPEQIKWFKDNYYEKNRENVLDHLFFCAQTLPNPKNNTFNN